MALKNLRSRIPDPRALPIAIKLAILLAGVLLVAGFFTDTAVRNVVTEGQQEVVLDDLETISRSNARRIVDVLLQEIAKLERFAENENVQAQMRVILANRFGLVGTMAEDGLIERETRIFASSNPEFISIAVVDADAKVRGLEPNPLTVVAADDLTGVSWFNRSFRSGIGGIYASSPITDELTGIEFVHLAVPIYNSENPEDVLGVVYGIWDMSNVLDITEVGENRESLVLEPNGNLLISGSEDFQFGDPVPVDATRFIGDATGSFHFTDPSGIEWLYGHTNINTFVGDNPDLRQLRWTVVVRQPVTAVQSNVVELSNSLRVVIGASSFLVTLIIALFAYILLLPLARLTRAASTLQKGDLNAPIPVLPSDEVGRLADVFRALVGQLVARLGELRAAVQVTRATSLTLDANQMLSDVARAVNTQFNYGDVRLYLTDPTGRRAQLQAASGTEAERLLRAQHRLAVDETTIAGRAMLLNETQTAAASGTAEVAIPLVAGNRSLGVLHVTTPREVGGFRDEEIDILRLVTDQISASIANARLFEQSQASLAEIETLNRRLTRDAWEEYIGEDSSIRHTLDPEEKWPLSEVGGGGRRRDDIRAEIIASPDGRSVLSVPLILRGESVGSLAVSRPMGERWSSDEVALLESVAARMSMIAEGIRLVDESNRRAMREQRVNEVSANLLARATSVESVLRNALSELGGALGSERVSLRLGTAPDAERPVTLAEPERRKSLPPRRPRPTDDAGTNGNS